MQLILLAIEDITDRKRSEEALRTTERRLRTVLETDAVGVLFFDQIGTLIDSNDAFLRITGYSRADVESGALTWRNMTPPEWIETSERQMQVVKQTGRIGPYEKEYLRKEGSRSWMMFAGRLLDDGSIVKFGIDIGDRKRAEAERELLVRELSHRVKNVFAIVQSLATLTNGRIRSIDAFREAFLGRLQALARAHNTLLDANWRGSELRALLETALEPYRLDRPTRVTLEGDSIPLTARQSLGLSLILHELGTNAAKYGALSQPGGRLRVSWRKEGQHEQEVLRLCWEERGGPQIAPPIERGFGSRLIEAACKYQLNGTLELDYAEEGLAGRIVFAITGDDPGTEALGQLSAG